MTQEDIDPIEKNVISNYQYVMRFARLHQWSKMVIDSNPDIAIVDFDINDMIPVSGKQFSCEDPVTEVYTMDEEFELFNVRMCLDMSMDGYHYLVFIQPNLRPTEIHRIDMTLEIFREHVNQLINLYNRCISTRSPLPLSVQLPTYPFPVIQVLEQAILKTLNGLIKGLKTDKGKKIAPDIIECVFSLFWRASIADGRVAAILLREFEQIQFIQLWLLDYLSKDTIHKPLKYWSAFQHPFYLGFALIDGLLSSIIDPDVENSIKNRHLKYQFREHKYTSMCTKLMRLIGPIIMKALKLRHRHPVVYFCAMKHFDELTRVFWIVPDAVISSIYCTQEAFGYYSSILKEKLNDSNTKNHSQVFLSVENSNEKLVDYDTLAKNFVLQILIKIVIRGTSSIDHTISKDVTDMFIGKSAFNVLENVDEEKAHIDTFRSHVQLIAELCRSIAFRDYLHDKGMDILVRLAKSNDPIVLGETFLAFNRLMWDKKWQHFFENMEPKIELVIAKWTASASLAIDKDVEVKQAILKVVDSLNTRRHYGKSNDLSNVPIAREEMEYKSWHLYNLYPDFNSTNKSNKKCVELLLTRIVLFACNFDKVRIDEKFMTRFRRIRLTELLTIFYDWPGDISYYISNTIPTFLACGEIIPEAFINPSSFVQHVCNNFLYEINIGVNKTERFEVNNVCMKSTLTLLSWLLNEEKCENSKWSSVVQEVTNKCLGEEKEYIPKMLLNIKLSEEQMKAARDSTPETTASILESPDVSRYCGNPKCKNHTRIDPKKKLKQCTRCKNTIYCSKECQKGIHIHHHHHHHHHHCIIIIRTLASA